MRYFDLNRQFNWAARHEHVELRSQVRDRLSALRLWQET
jgi:hypothetical protein